MVVKIEERQRISKCFQMFVLQSLRKRAAEWFFLKADFSDTLMQ